MIDVLARAELATFSEIVGGTFDIIGPVGDEPVCVWSLVEANVLPHGQPGGREPFSLIFEGPAVPALPQGTYVLRNSNVGGMPMFVVPISERADTRRYQAIFN